MMASSDGKGVLAFILDCLLAFWDWNGTGDMANQPGLKALVC